MQKTALITGASSGFGREFASLLAKDGYNLVLTARNKEALKEIKRELEAAYPTQVTLIIQDLALPHAGQTIYKHLEEHNLQIDVLINNAGFGVFGHFSQTSLERELEMVQVHIAATVELTKLLLPGMLERKSGRILNMASLAAFLPGPSMALYYASKAFILSFSQSLSKELANTGVSVTVLCPGPTATGFQKVAFSKGVKTGLKRNLASPREIALYGYRALRQGKLIAIPRLRDRILIYISHLLPSSWVLDYMQKYNEG